MKYCVIGPTYPFRGGIAHYTTLLVKHLRERHDVRFISYLKQYPKWLYPGNTAMDPSPESSVLQVPCERLLTPLNPLTWWRVYRRIRQDPPDALILQWWTPFWSPMLFFLTRMIRLRTQTRILFLCHHVVAPDGGLFDWTLAQRILKRGHAFIVMSEDDFALVRHAMPNALVRGAAHPPPELLGMAPISQAEARQKLGLAAAEPVVLFFGFVRRYKGLPVLIEALAKARTRLPIRLVIAGEFWEDESIYRDQVARLGLNDAVRFYNAYVPNNDMATFFAAADIVALPYLEATQSGVVQWSYAFEKPIIATSVGGLPEAVIHEQTGLLVPPGDAQALAEAMLRFFRENKSAAFVENIRAANEERSWQPLVKLIEELTGACGDATSKPACQRRD